MYLRQARWQRNMTQLELALQVGMTQNRISAIERGLSRPHPEEIKSLAKALEMKPDELQFVEPIFPKSRVRMIAK